MYINVCDVCICDIIDVIFIDLCKISISFYCMKKIYYIYYIVLYCMNIIIFIMLLCLFFVYMYGYILIYIVFLKSVLLIKSKYYFL